MDSKPAHLVFNIRGDEPSPTGSGTPSQWLEHYKLTGEGEAFVHWYEAPEDCYEPQPGDILWFQVHYDVRARTTVLRTMRCAFTGRLELWYRLEDVKRMAGLGATMRGCCILDDEEARQWQSRFDEYQTRSTGTT